MAIRLLGIQDTKTLETFLSPHNSQCMFICSNLKAAGIDYKNDMFHGEYWGYLTDSNTLEGVIVHYWNGNVMMCAPDTEILKHLVSELKNNSQRPIAGVLGPNMQAEFVIKELRLLNKDYNINSNEGLYEIDLHDLNALERPLNFHVIQAKAISKDLLIKWMQDYEIEALGADKSSDLQKRAELTVNRFIKGDCSVLTVNETPVSLSAFNARIDGMVQVGPVWTPPEYRNQGFARFLLSYTLNEEKRKGTKKAILFTDNPAAIKAYESVGFKMIGHYRLALLKEQIHPKKLCQSNLEMSG